MTPTLWDDPASRAVALYLDGDIVHGSEGTVVDDDFLLFFNGSSGTVNFTIPTHVGNARRWTVAVDTAESTRRTVSDGASTCRPSPSSSSPATPAARSDGQLGSAMT